MRKLLVYNQITLDGFFKGIDGDISWAHKERSNTEWNSFVAGNVKSAGPLVFGRVTYEMMAAYWPTSQASVMDAGVAEHMNRRPKVVFSRSLRKVSWSNSRLVREGLAAEIRTMKNEPGDDMTILGSGSLVRQLAQEGLIDEFQVVVTPNVIGEGKTMFDGIEKTLTLKLTRTRIFKNGNVLLCYAPNL